MLSFELKHRDIEHDLRMKNTRKAAQHVHAFNIEGSIAFLDGFEDATTHSITVLTTSLSVEEL